MKQSNSCYQCGGKGTVALPAYHWLGWRYERQLCQLCGGSGKWERPPVAAATGASAPAKEAPHE